MIEASKAIVGAGNTTPDKDGISSAILRLAWPYISNVVLELFQARSILGTILVVSGQLS